MIQLCDINEDTILKFTKVDHKFMKLAWHEVSFSQGVHKDDDVNIKCTTQHFEQESLDHSSTKRSKN